MKESQSISKELINLTETWLPELIALPEEVISTRRNMQNRNIKQIVGHMIDSASNNTHRIIHLQYRESPVDYPDYANFGVNDLWISIQNYQDADWNNLVMLWRYSNLHIAHVIENIDPVKLDHQWISAKGETINLKDMVIDYPRHFRLHLDEIQALIDKK